MIVVGIIAIFMTMGIPSLMRGMERDDLSKAVRDTIEGCKTARDRAILQGVPWEFVVISGTGEIGDAQAGFDVRAAPHEDRNRGAGTAGGGGKSIPAAPHSGFPRKLGEDVYPQLIDVNFVSQMEAPEARVRFFPNGTADEFTVVFAYKGRQRSVTIDIITGQAMEFVKP